jgi:hypothetical protein
MQAAAKVGEYTPLGDRELKLGADLDFRIRALEEVVLAALPLSPAPT